MRSNRVGVPFSPLGAFVIPSTTARTAGNEIAHNPPFAVGHYFLHFHYHRSQIGSGCMLRPLLRFSVPCPRVRPPFNLGTLISVVMPEMPWIRGGYALGHPFLVPLDLLYFSTLQ